ncbi:MAG: hypothetical protein ACM319_03760 [Deltaproteobacteria bacterium]|nr:hypothetical protein [Candidatus Deferrimicrobiaceae bacterium]
MTAMSAPRTIHDFGGMGHIDPNNPTEYRELRESASRRKTMS